MSEPHVIGKSPKFDSLNRHRPESTFFPLRKSEFPDFHSTS